MVVSNRETFVQARVTGTLRRKLESWAKAENRSLSNLIERLLIEAVGERQQNGKAGHP